MIWLAVIVGLVLVVGIAVFAVARVSVELEGTMAPALLEIEDAVEVCLLYTSPSPRDS